MAGIPSIPQLPGVRTTETSKSEGRLKVDIRKLVKANIPKVKGIKVTSRKKSVSKPAKAKALPFAKFRTVRKG